MRLIKLSHCGNPICVNPRMIVALSKSEVTKYTFVQLSGATSIRVDQTPEEILELMEDNE